MSDLNLTRQCLTLSDRIRNANYGIQNNMQSKHYKLNNIPLKYSLYLYLRHLRIYKLTLLGQVKNLPSSSTVKKEIQAVSKLKKNIPVVV